ncbi:aberrant root formation protein 4 [Phtheirospermum japonicum]|uniref:Aberrant root formation protein 4 n=1 Tax=Phtheirospermum japonicum TaxID=374723 RepID=A0A830BZ82_9LAMI|nr:aberrant root formation protein 4 [Phtheirospermum japonicum]
MIIVQVEVHGKRKLVVYRFLLEMTGIKLIEAGDYSSSEQSIAELVNSLNSISDSLVAEEHENEDSEKIAIEILTQIHRYVDSPEVKQEAIDALAFELPKAVARFACVSTRCSEVAENVVDSFVGRCSPRDMLPILCEAIGSSSEFFMVPGYFTPLLSGLMKALVLIQRQHYRHVKTAVPVILNALKIVCFKSDYEDEDYEKLFRKAEGEDKKKLNALLGLYVLQIMVDNSCESEILVFDAHVSVGISSDVSICLPVVLELSDSLLYCELSYIGLITGLEVDMILKLAFGETTDDRVDDMNCFSEVKLGAALAVIWGYKASEVAVAAKADLPAVIMELQSNLTKRWESIGMLRYIFSCPNLSWDLKEHGMRFLLCIMDGIVSHSDDEHVDYSMHLSTLYTSLQAIQMVIMFASDSVLRKNAFSALKKVLADIPASVRFDVLWALIKNGNSSSMIGILLDYVKQEMHMGKIKGGLSSEVSQSSSFWNPSVLELLEEVLRPPKGGPPRLPEYSDAVLSALNLFRYILITESTVAYSDAMKVCETGNSNYTGVLSKDKLHKAYNEWLLPLRTLVMQTAAESQKEYEQLACDVICALNPIEMVLYRCIELVEENLKHLQ